MEKNKEPLLSRLWRLTWEGAYRWVLGLALAALVSWLSQRKMPTVTAHPAEYWLATAAVFFGSLVLVLSIAGLGNSLLVLLKRRSFRKNITARLHILDESEKAKLRFFITKDRRGMHFDMNDVVVANLIVAGILFRPTRIGAIHAVPTTISEVAWKYLHEHPELLNPHT